MLLVFGRRGGIVMDVLDWIFSDALRSLLCFFLVFVLVEGIVFAINLRFALKREKLLRILMEQLEPERFIQETQKWLSRLVLQAHIHTLRSDLAHAYFLQGQYDAAIRILWEIQPPRSNRMNKMLYYNNLTCYYLAVGDLKSAAACFQDGEKYIEKTLQSQSLFCRPYHSNLFDTKAQLLYHQGELQESEKLFLQAQQLGDSNRTASCDLYLARIYIQTNRAEQAKILVDSVLMHPNFPCYVAQAEQLKQRWMAEVPSS